MTKESVSEVALSSSESPLESQKTVFGSNGDNVDEEPPALSADTYLGSDKTIRMPQNDSVIELEGQDVTLNFESTPLEDVVHGILGDTLKQDYVVEGKIPGVVSLRTQTPIPRKELLVILESMLDANGAAMVKRADGRYLVTASKRFRSANPSFQSRENLKPGYSNVIVPLQYIGAAHMAEVLKPVAPDSAFIRIDAVRNLLILGGGSTQLQGWLDIIQTFDVDYLSGMSVGVFPIEYTTADEINSALATLMATSVGDKASPLSGLIRTVPLESLGSVLVVTPRKELLAQVETWIERLDRTPTQGAEPQLYVYSVENGEADHLAQLISRVFGGSGGSSSRGNSGVAPGLTSTNMSSGDDGSAVSSSNKSSNRSGAASYSLGDTARIVADDVNNTLLIYATGAEYRKIEGALRRLDVMPSQILIEASIIEVRLTDSLQYGLEWYFENSLDGGWTGQGNIGLGLGADGSVNASLPDFGYVFNNSLGQIQGVLNALADKDLIKVLSTPSIMVMDNQSASIQVGDSTPVLSSTTNGQYGSTQNISYRDTGVQLDVRPSVNAGGLVTMELQQSVTDVGSGGASNTPTFFQRAINSKVAVRSGESVVLGGLISDSQNSRKTGLPFFSDLPVIGWMFGGSTVEEERQELLVIITPHVMKTDQDLRNVTKEMRSRMKGLEAFQQSIDDSKLVDPSF
ncbi:type II secretion system secretin GspD [uncultured Gilvimarinus sp.]|uniref:type II secretion system secretin GspD n=1 Tax=uncultured Gilvimarinus sp. TaxID=1689143 RepID=UPI0030DB8F34